jgi:GrpB-like predicted nucleotidyltransferase (UPF0157 family)
MSTVWKVVIVPYDPTWPHQFDQEARHLTAAFGRNLITIHHIGSTSVPGLPAKPIIDLMPVVHDLDRIADAEAALIALGYTPRGENGIPGRRYFSKHIENNHTHHVHTYQAGHHEVTTHLNFRDYLRAHPQTAAAYGRLKATLAQQFPQDILAYTNAKAPFITDTLQKAAAWRLTHHQQ